MSAGCLDENAVLAFLDGRLSGPGRVQVEAHLLSCPSCNDLVTWAAADLEQPSRPTGGEGQPFLGQLEPGAPVGRYQVLGAVGRGGMGEVYAAYHPDLDRRIALKVVYEGGATQSERRARLLREARAIARLSHPNVITVYDAGVIGDRVYIAMELVEGQTLEKWMREGARGWREILDVFIAAGRGLAAAHAAGVIHRDFKPGNVMIGLDGSVRVMDFGLARLANEADTKAGGSDPAGDRPVFPTTVTRTGAFLGTPAYMSPEQFSGVPIDPRSDQFSFCVGLHEALAGTRPPLPHLPARKADDGGGAGASKPMRPPGMPAWLRHVLARGLSEKREERYPSMQQLLSALGRGRTRLRRRLAVAAAAGVIVLASLGGWGLARGGRVTCAVPKDRLANVWAAPARKETIHRAFISSGHGAAQGIWQRVSAALDDYVDRWAAMYVETCEATHVRGEQSPEVLDLRMACLNDKLDQVSALASALATVDKSAVSRAMGAASDLAPLARCADVARLRSAMPLPRDERTLRAVQDFRRSLADVEALRELGNERSALAKALALRPAVEALGYKPLIGETLYSIGLLQIHSQPAEAEPLLEQALFLAQAAGNDEQVAKIGTSLIFAAGYQLGKYRDAERWNSLTHATLDRLGPSYSRLRAWAHQDYSAVLFEMGQSDESRRHIEQAIRLKEESLGKDHPDVAVSLSNLCLALTDLGEHQLALGAQDRSIAILSKVDPNHASLLFARVNRAEVLRMLGRHDEARAASKQALEMATAEVGPAHPFVAHPLHNLGEIELAASHPKQALPLLERALEIRSRDTGHPIELAETQFAVARALAASGHERRRARELSAAALESFKTHKRAKEEQAVGAWRATTR